MTKPEEKVRCPKCDCIAFPTPYTTGRYFCTNCKHKFTTLSSQ